MRIMHYSLGFPPYRRGGMTKYCVDLMIEQKKAGYDVGMIWPGRLTTINGASYIKKKSKNIISDIDLDSFELINPMPVPLLDGISDINPFVASKSNNKYKVFWDKYKPEVLHVHTLMGLPYELVKEAKECGIKIIFTTHDYFGLCPRGSLFYEGNNCTDMCNCTQCNKNALSLKKIKILQSPLYRTIKDTFFIKILRSNHALKVANIDHENDLPINAKINNSEYGLLRNYYLSFFELFDTIHFNSSLTMQIYNKFYDAHNKSVVLNISHGDIKDCRKLKKTHDKIMLGYLGSCVDNRKGFYLLKHALDMVNKKYHGLFVLKTYGECPYDDDYLRKNEHYRYSDLPQVLEGIDIVILPSIWYETFGFTALEALSYAVPVVVTDHVGAKDIICNGKNGFVVECNEYALERVLERIIEDKKIIGTMNNYIIDEMTIKDMQEHSTEICNLYLTLCN